MTSHYLKAVELVAAASCGSLYSSRTHAASGDVYNLGTLDGTQSSARDVNAAGQVTGLTFTPTALHAFRYIGTPGAGGVMQDLGTLGGGNSYGWAINASGQVVGESYIDHQTSHAFL